MRASILTQKRAKTLRREMTEPERMLWALLRRKQHGLRFRRQHAMGPYILDFYCAAEKLCVEIDGPSHEERQEHDARRTVWLEAQGVRVMRFTVADVTERSAWVVVEIERVGSELSA